MFQSQVLIIGMDGVTRHAVGRGELTTGIFFFLKESEKESRSFSYPHIGVKAETLERITSSEQDFSFLAEASVFPLEMLQSQVIHITYNGIGGQESGEVISCSSDGPLLTLCVDFKPEMVEECS